MSDSIGADQILAFFRSAGQTSRVVHDNTTATGGLGLATERQKEMKRKQNVIPKYRHDNASDYTRQYIVEEETQMWNRMGNMTVQPTAAKSSLMSVEEFGEAGDCAGLMPSLMQEQTERLFLKYHTKYKYDPSLPITQYRQRIVDMIESYQAIVIQGSTGSGKTTQVPQYILDHYANSNRHCNIVVTQPRRIAAISIANRVCQERRWNVGELVGYQVGMDKKTSENTRLTYMTTGVLLQKLVCEKRMDEYTHIIIDEVHERDQYTDFVLLIVRKFLKTTSRTVKVILMSATFDTDMFSYYFSMPVANRLEPAPVLVVEGKTFEVSQYYYDDFSPLTRDTLSLALDKPEINPDSFQLVLKLIKMFDGFDNQVNNLNSKYPGRGTVLVFLPGIFEIRDLEACLSSTPDFNALKWAILPLHSTVTIDEQIRAFQLPQKGWRKIILATNIAESSITVPDIQYVIDFCLVKQLVCDKATHYTCLELQWASKANCVQRMGRAGRVQSGRVYRIITKDMYDQLPEHSQPEMTRCPLENTILKVKQLDMGEPKALLALAMEPPSLSDIERTIILLKEAGALTMYVNGFFNQFDGDLTFIGRIMANLPLDIRISRMIVFGYALGCLEQCVIMAACLASKTFFASPHHLTHQAYKNKISLALGSFSDPLTALNVYEKWQAKKVNGEFEQPGGETEARWCKKNFIQLRRLRDVELQVDDLKLRIANVGISCNSNTHTYDSMEDLMILKLVLGGAFYPNYFLCDTKEEEFINKELNNFNPLSTVCLGGLPRDEGILYMDWLTSFFQENCDSRVNVFFENTKGYIQFESSNSNNQADCILPAVYNAIKMRQLRIPIEIQALEPREAEVKMKQIQIMLNNGDQPNQLDTKLYGVLKSATNIKNVDLPDHNTSSIEIDITHVEKCGHFWARYSDQETTSRLIHITQTINNTNFVTMQDTIMPGMIVLAPFENFLYRARVEAARGPEIFVFFVDFGNTIITHKSCIKHIDPEICPSLLSTPALAFECVLSEIRPSVIKNSVGQWSEEAEEQFSKFTQLGLEHNFHGKIYSVVHNVVRLELFRKHQGNGTQDSINEHLLAKGLAEKAQESLLSKKNHKVREDSFFSRNTIYEPMNKFLNYTSIPKINTTRRGGRRMQLKGPSSPLEMRFSALVQTASSKCVKINNDSVNSVALDAEPWEKSQKLLIAAHMGLSASRSVIRVNGTTLMPNIRGLSSLLPMIFAPKAELRVDPKRTKYTGVLCGLGTDEIDQIPFYPDHDMEISFDIKVQMQDIVDVNAIRMAFNMLLGGKDQVASDTVSKIQKKCRELLLKLFRANREIIEPQLYRNNFQWDMISKTNLLSPSIDSDSGDCPHLLPLISAVALDTSVDNANMERHLKELHDKAAERSNRYEIITCNLCVEKVYSSQELVIHLISSTHQNKERIFKNSLAEN